MVNIKEAILNYTVNRWGRNRKSYVGATSESIRKCKPNNLKEWEDYYFGNVKSKQHIEQLGKEVYNALKNTVRNEGLFDISAIDSITEQDCIDYMFNLVIKRVYDGYVRENS